MNPGEKEGPRDDDALGQILNSLQGNGSSSSLTPKSNNNGRPPKREMEQYPESMMEQRTQTKTFLEESKEMKREISILQTKSKKSDSEIVNLRSLLESEREGKAVLEATINSLHDMLQNTVEVVRSRFAAIEESIKVLRKDGNTREASKVNEAIEGLSSISNEIEVRFAEVNENIQQVKESVEESDKRTQSNLEDSQLNYSKVDGSHGRLRDELQNIKSAMKELEERMESEIQRTVTETEKNQSRVTDEIQQQTLQLLLASERDGKALLDATINSRNVAIQNTFEALRSRLAATEESTEVLKEKEVDNTRQISKLDEAIERWSSISKKIEAGVTEVNKNHATLVNDIQRVTESMEESEKRIQSELDASKRSFSMEDRRVRDELRNFKVAMEGLEKRMQPEVQLTVTETDQSGGVTNEFQQLDGTTSELSQRIMPEVPLMPATAEGVDGGDNDIPIITISDDEEEMDEDEAVPQDPFTLSSGPGKYKAASAAGPPIGSENEKNSDPPSSTTPSTTVQNQDVTHARDITKRDGVFCTCGRQFVNDRSLQKHILYYNTDNSEKKFVCLLCSQRFLWLGDLRQHQLIKHDITPEGIPRGCRKCGQIFRTVQKQMTHFKCCNGGQVKKVQETSKAIAPSPPKPSTRKSTSVAEVPLTPATTEGGDGSENNLPTTISDEEEMEEEEVPHEQEVTFTLSSVPGSVGQEMGSKNKKRKLPPPSTTVQNQDVTHSRDITKRDGVFCTCGHQFMNDRSLQTHILYYSILRLRAMQPTPGIPPCRKCGQIFRTLEEQVAHLKCCSGGQVKKVEETSKARPLAPSPPSPSTSKSTRVAEEKIRRHHQMSLLRPMFCVCGRKLSSCRLASKV